MSNPSRGPVSHLAGGFSGICADYPSRLEKQLDGEFR